MAAQPKASYKRLDTARRLRPAHFLKRAKGQGVALATGCRPHLQTAGARARRCSEDMVHGRQGAGHWGTLGNTGAARPYAVELIVRGGDKYHKASVPRYRTAASQCERRHLMIGGETWRWTTNECVGGPCT